MRQRHETFSRQPGGYLCGLRTQAGEWLSLIGGWRQDETTVLQWQLNLSGYERFSLVTVARSFWIEHEIARGSRILRIDGGTTHAMNHSFTPEKAVDLILRRRSLLAYAMVKIAAPLIANHRIPVAQKQLPGQNPLPARPALAPASARSQARVAARAPVRSGDPHRLSPPAGSGQPCTRRPGALSASPTAHLQA